MRDWRDAFSESAGSVDLAHGAIDTAVVDASTDSSPHNLVLRALYPWLEPTPL